MDAVGLSILEQELGADLVVLRDASAKARQRLSERTPGFAEAAAYELARHYTVLEKALERICQTFENHFDKRADYHERLLQRVGLDLPGIRPAFIPSGAVAPLRELKGFRHVVRHAYDLALRPERLDELTAIAEKVSTDFEAWLKTFVTTVRKEQGW
ncbi:MAG: hypothetical protein ACREIA_26865 [Opitutaceae bacterium]